jgi:acetyl esterase/lipase
MTPAAPTPEQLDAILDLQGHEPCPGVEIEFNLPLGSVPGGPGLHATLYRPSRRPAAPTPALLAFHGGGWTSGDPNGCGALAKMLALTLGMPTLSASYRLAPGTGPTYPGGARRRPLCLALAAPTRR